MAVHQGTLFPDGAELWGRALDALRELDVEGARRHVSGASALAADQLETAEIEQTIDWLEACELSPGAPLDRAVRAFRETAQAVRLGLISAGAGRRADKALARHLVRRAEPGSAFVGDGEPLPTGRLLLVLDQRGRALRPLLRALEGGGEPGSSVAEAEVWSALGDVYHLEGDEGDALAYARALALDPAAVEPFRLCHRALADLAGRLGAVHGAELARQRLLVEAWLAGLVRVPERDPWHAARAERWAAERAALPDGTAEGRARLFTLLFLEDRAADPRSADADRRLLMHELDPRLLERMVDAIRDRERAAPRLPMR